MEQKTASSAAAQPEALAAEARPVPEAPADASSPSETGPGAAKELSSDHEEPDKRRPASSNVRDSDYPKRVGSLPSDSLSAADHRRCAARRSRSRTKTKKCGGQSTGWPSSSPRSTSVGRCHAGARRFESKAPKGSEAHEQQLKKRANKHK